MVCTSKETYALIDYLFTLELNTSPDKAIDRTVLAFFINVEKLSEDFDVSKETKLYLKGAFKHLRWLLIMKASGYRIRQWGSYITRKERYEIERGQFCPLVASKELGLIYFDQMVLD